MHTTRAMSSALAGGYDLDPDLPSPPHDNYGTLGGLHVLRHLQRYLDVLGMQVVLLGDREHSNLTDLVDRGYDSDVTEAELRRYRFISSPSRIRTVLRDEPRSVPIFAMSGSQCLGWRENNWDGVCVGRNLRPGRLFGFTAHLARMSLPKNGVPYTLHLAAWQPPFPTHSLVTWGNDAALLEGAQEIESRVHAGFLFSNGGRLTYAEEDSRRVRDWTASAEAESLAARTGITELP